MGTADILNNQEKNIKWFGSGEAKFGELWMSSKQVKLLFNLHKKEQGRIMTLDLMRVHHNGWSYRAGRYHRGGRILILYKLAE